MSDLTIKTLAVEDDLVELALAGALDAKGATRLKARCFAARADGCKYMIFDLSAVNLISSAGVGVLLLLREDLADIGGEAIFAALPPEVLSVLRCMDLVSVMEIVATLEDARELLVVRTKAK